MKRVFSAVMLILLLTSMLILTLNIQPVKATGTIYIRADGSIEPSDAPMSSVDNVTYVFAGNITSDADGIVIERSNIIVDGNGYTLRGSGSGNGFYLSSICNTTIKTTRITEFYHCMNLENSTNDKLINNSMTNSNYGLLLENCDNNVIDSNDLSNNNYHGTYLYYSENNTISNNSIANIGGTAVMLDSSNGTFISDNTVANSGESGIRLWDSHDSIIINNTVTKNGRCGIVLASSSANSVLRQNRMAGNTYNFGVEIYEPASLSSFNQDIDSSNIVDGKPVIYWVNQTNKAVPTNAGYVALVNCRNTVTRDLDLQNNSQGVLLAYTEDSIIDNVKATGNWEGFWLHHSSNVSVCQNVIANNEQGMDLYEFQGEISRNMIADNKVWGIYLWNVSDTNIALNTITGSYYGINAGRSSGNILNSNNIRSNGVGVQLSESQLNTIHHNNFVNNTEHVSLYESYNNAWDDGYPSGGNYWSDYTGTDLYSGPYQNVTGSDGIGDTPNVIDVDNVDHYPLMRPYGVLLGDVNGDGKVNLKDVMVAVQAFNSFPGTPRWNVAADLDNSGRVDMRDLVLIVLNFNKHE